MFVVIVVLLSGVPAKEHLVSSPPPQVVCLKKWLEQQGNEAKFSKFSVFCFASVVFAKKDGGGGKQAELTSKDLWVIFFFYKYRGIKKYVQNSTPGGEDLDLSRFYLLT